MFRKRILDRLKYASLVFGLMLAGCRVPPATPPPAAKSPLAQKLAAKLPPPQTLQAEGAAVFLPPPMVKTFVIECESWPVQGFEVISSPTPNGPWTHYTNVVQQDRFTVPTKLAQNFFTIGRTWLVGNTNDVLRWKGW